MKTGLIWTQDCHITPTNFMNLASWHLLRLRFGKLLSNSFFFIQKGTLYFFEGWDWLFSIWFKPNQVQIGHFPLKPNLTQWNLNLNPKFQTFEGFFALTSSRIFQNNEKSMELYYKKRTFLWKFKVYWYNHDYMFITQKSKKKKKSSTYNRRCIMHNILLRRYGWLLLKLASFFFLPTT